MTDDPDNNPYLCGQLLVAMPGMTDPRFAKSVIYLCAHNADGAMGLVVNKTLEDLSFPDLLTQLNLDPTGDNSDIRIHFGGPVDNSRGFVLHTNDYLQDASIVVEDDIALTATLEILQDIVDGSGPGECLLALGYAGWGPGQLDDEIKANGWLHVTADADLIFRAKPEDKWEKSMVKLGIDPRMLSDDAGHA